VLRAHSSVLSTCTGKRKPNKQTILSSKSVTTIIGKHGDKDTDEHKDVHACTHDTCARACVRACFYIFSRILYYSRCFFFFFFFLGSNTQNDSWWRYNTIQILNLETWNSTIVFFFFIIFKFVLTEETYLRRQ